LKIEMNNSPYGPHQARSAGSGSDLWQFYTTYCAAMT
jgi:hypothetical protein